MNTNNIVGGEYIDRLVQWNERLAGLPSGVLVFIAVIGVGYLLKGIKQYPNALIPHGVVLSASLLFVLLAPSDGASPLRIWWAKNLVIGFIIGFLAWLSHRFVISKLEDWLEGKREQRRRETEFISKPVEPVVPKD